MMRARLPSLAFTWVSDVAPSLATQMWVLSNASVDGEASM